MGSDVTEYDKGYFFKCNHGFKNKTNISVCITRVQSVTLSPKRDSCTHEASLSAGGYQQSQTYTS